MSAKNLSIKSIPLEFLAKSLCQGHDILRTTFCSEAWESSD